MATGTGSPRPAKLAGPRAGRGPVEGFGLLEVLVATALMGLVLVVLLQVLTSVLRCQDTSWSHTQAVLVAEKALEENCELNSLKAGTYQGDSGRFSYVVRVTPQYEVGDLAAGKHLICSLIQVTVTWQERGRPMTLTLATVRTGEAGRS